MIYPLTICFDRYTGVYSGGLYTAWNCDSENVPTEISDDDVTCADFWSDVRNDRYSFLPTFGVGSTAEEAVENLRKKLNAVEEDHDKETRTSDIFCEGNLDVVSVAKVREALGISEDRDIFEWITVLKKSDERAHSEMYKARGEKYELERRVREILGINREVDFFEALQHARGDIDTATRLRLESSELRHQNHQFGRRLADIREASGMADDDRSDLVEYIETLRKSAEKYEYMYNDLLKEVEKIGVFRGNVDYFADLAQGRQKALSNLRDEILKVYREIFDCSNGDPEGSDEETLQDILTEYKRTLELKNMAEEKTIKYKELARGNEEKAAKYKDTAKENRVQWNNTKAQLQWAQKENLEWVKRYDKLKSEFNEMKQKLSEIKDIYER